MAGYPDCGGADLDDAIAAQATLDANVLIGIDASRAALANHTGTETYAYQLIQALAAHASKEIGFRLYTQQHPAPAAWPRSPYVETRVLPFPRLWTHLRLAAEIIRHPPDCLFVPAHVLPLICPVPAFVTVHDLGYLYHPETHTPFQRWYLNWTTRRHTKVARHIIADSAATRQDLIQHYDADPAKIDVVHLGRDPAIQRVTNPQPVLEKFGIDGPYLLYVGTLQPRKNLLRLLEAFHQISPQFAVSLVLAGGKGWLTDQLFARIRTLKLDDRVILPGYVSEGDKAALLSGSTAFVYPSLYEGFGIPLLEAMACQTPIVTSNLSSMPEIAGDAALLVDPYDVASISEALRQILSDAAVREALVVRGSKRLAAFSWAKAAQQTLDILTQKIG